jgi:ParB-like chromosome segregation protein Spo0J
MSGLEVRVLPIDQLQPATYNPRRPLKPTSRAYRKLRKSLEEFGLVEPLIWNELTGRVVGGHARLAILKDLGVTGVPVSVVRLDEPREKALNVVLNNQEAQSRYDPELLRDLLTELQPVPELELTGFDEAMIESLKFEPAELPPAEETASDRVEITLVTDAATFEKLSPKLDRLIGRFDLISHVHRG